MDYLEIYRSIPVLCDSHSICTPLCLENMVRILYNSLKYIGKWGIWVAQLVKRLTHDFSTGHDLRVREIEPCQHGACLGFSPLLICMCARAHVLSLSNLVKKMTTIL